MTGGVLIEPAAESDYPQILELNEGAVPNVNAISTTTLTSLHRQALALITATDTPTGALAGFLLCLPDSANYDSVNFGYFRKHYSNFAYVDRIVVSDRHRRRGIGVALYQHLFTICGDDRELVSCEVNLEPPNPNSMRFHEQLGFTTVDEQRTEGGSKRVALMVRRI